MDVRVYPTDVKVKATDVRVKPTNVKVLPTVIKLQYSKRRLWLRFRAYIENGR